MLTVLDAKCNLTFPYVDQYRSSNNCAAFVNPKIGQAIENNTLGIPEPDDYIDAIDGKVSYYLLGDEIFLLITWFTRLDPDNLLEAEQIYNYLQSRRHLPLENTFDILVTKWRKTSSFM